MTADITLVQTTTVRVEVQNGRVARLMDVTDETRPLEGIDRPFLFWWRYRLYMPYDRGRTPLRRGCAGLFQGQTPMNAFTRDAALSARHVGACLVRLSEHCAQVIRGLVQVGRLDRIAPSNYLCLRQDVDQHALEDVVRRGVGVHTVPSSSKPRAYRNIPSFADPRQDDDRFAHGTTSVVGRLLPDRSLSFPREGDRLFEGGEGGQVLAGHGVEYFETSSGRPANQDIAGLRLGHGTAALYYDNSAAERASDRRDGDFAC
jgi:hypothetical protein